MAGDERVLDGAGPDGGSGTADVWSLPGYRVGRAIGRGGFATVYEAEQVSLGRQVAIKILLADLATEAHRRRFDRERDILSRLSEHPFIVDVHDAGVTAELRPFIVMRLYRRGSLAGRSEEHGPMPVPDVVSMITKVADALDCAHGLGVLHRDVKPENVLLTDTGEPALSDFGISALTERSGTSHNSTAFFTISHAAPEVLESQTFSVASDVYALASTAYQLLAGHPAFTGSGLAVMAQIVTADPPPLGRPDVPPALEAAVRQGMAKEPQQRPGSAGRFAQSLAAALGVQARPAPGRPSAVTDALPGTPTTRPSPPPPPPVPMPPLVAGAPPPVPPPFPFAQPGPPGPPAPSGRQGYPGQPVPLMPLMPLAPHAPGAARPAGRSAGVLVAAVLAVLVAVGGVAWILRARDDGGTTSTGTSRTTGSAGTDAATVPGSGAAPAAAPGGGAASRTTGAAASAAADSPRAAASTPPALAPTTTVVSNEPVVTAVSFQPGGELLAVPMKDNVVQLVDIRTGAVRTTLKGEQYGTTNAVAFTPDGTMLAGSGASARVWTSAGRLTHVLTPDAFGQGLGSPPLAFAADGRHLVTSGASSRNVHFWDTATGKQLGTADLGSPVAAVAVTPNGRTVVALTAERIAILDMGGTSWGGRPTATRSITFADPIPEGRGGLAISPDGKTVAATSPNAHAELWDLATGTSTGTLDDAVNTGYGKAQNLAFSPDGTLLLTATVSIATVWELSAHAIRYRLQGPLSSINAVAFAPDGHTLATVHSTSPTCTVKLWRLS